MKVRSLAIALAVVALPRHATADDFSPKTVQAPQLWPQTGARDQANDAPREDLWTQRPRALMLQGGSGGGPLGYGGLSFEYSPVRYFVAGLGGGVSKDGATAAIMPRLRLPLGRNFAVGLGVPLSAGPYEYVVNVTQQCDFAGCQAGFRTSRTWSLAWWAHLEPNVEMRIAQGVALRAYGGHSFVINRHDDACVSTSPGGCPSNLGERRWYGGLALGYAW